MKKFLTPIAIAAMLLLVPLAAVSAAEKVEWTGAGEVLDMGCYEKGQKGPGHASCAKRCLSNGSAMGLLTDDGTLVLIKKEGSDAGAYETLQGLGGEKARVWGMAETVDGKTILTVKSGQPMG